MANAILTAINSKIAALANAEKVTKAVLGELSRELLSYVMLPNDDGVTSYDVDAVNRTLAACTPANKAVAVLYFNEFLPFAFDEAECSFGKMHKKGREEALAKLKAWLDVDANNIWTWYTANVRIDKKAPDYAKLITKNVAKALEDEENGLDVKEIMLAVLAADGINVADILGTLAGIREQQDNQGADLKADNNAVGNEAMAA